MQGLDAERGIRNVTFDNVVINGHKMTNLDRVETNEFAKGITVR